jgi:hypothetical protein
MRIDLQLGCTANGRSTVSGSKLAVTTTSPERRIATGLELSGYLSGTTPTLCSARKSSKYACCFATFIEGEHPAWPLLQPQKFDPPLCPLLTQSGHSGAFGVSGW